jgi:hypothetical protein
MAVLEIVILIAVAISDSLHDVRAWTLVAGFGAAYILSRGSQRQAPTIHRAPCDA